MYSLCWFFLLWIRLDLWFFFLSDKKSVESRRRKIAHFSLFGSRIQCRFCHEKLKGNKQYFQHIRQFHLPSISKKSCQTLDSTIPLTVPEIPTTSQLPTPIKKVNISKCTKQSSYYSLFHVVLGWYFGMITNLYIPSTINIWKKVLTKAIWADKKWAGFWQISL